MVANKKENYVKKLLQFKDQTCLNNSSFVLHLSSQNKVINYEIRDVAWNVDTHPLSIGP